MKTYLQRKSPQDQSPTLPEITDILGAVDRDEDLPLSYDRLIRHGDCIVDGATGVLQAFRNRWLFTKPLARRCLDIPAIVIGSGPSLDQAIPYLRELQSSCVLIAAHSALQRLHDGDVRPHFWAPVERIPVYTSDGNLISGTVPDVCYAGLPIVPDAADHCGSQWLVTNVDPLYKWLKCPTPEIAGVSGTGVHAAYLAAHMTSGPVYLVGNDIAAGHCRGYPWKDAESASDNILCVDGLYRPVQPMYIRMWRELSWLAHSHLVIQTSPTGADIPGAIHAPLPTPGSSWSMPSLTVDPAIATTVHSRYQELPRICSEAERRLKTSASCMNDVSAANLVGEHAPVWQILFGSLYLSMSCLRRTQGWSESAVSYYTAKAMLNALDGLSCTLQEIEHA